MKIIFILLFSFFLLQSCSFQTDVSIAGKEFNVEKIDNLKKGVTKKDEIPAILGSSPYEKSGSGSAETWRYVFKEDRARNCCGLPLFHYGSEKVHILELSFDGKSYLKDMKLRKSKKWRPGIGNAKAKDYR